MGGLSSPRIDFVFQIVEEAARGAEFELGEDGGGLLQAHGFIQHLARGAAAVIAHAVEMHDLGKLVVGHVSRRHPAAS